MYLYIALYKGKAKLLEDEKLLVCASSQEHALGIVEEWDDYEHGWIIKQIGKADKNQRFGVMMTQLAER